ncbi:MAG: hypothetical protein ACKPKO_22450, partial [Candidatus Fonsibacter sp.]
LEAGGPKGSRKAGEHEFSDLGLYTCLDGELGPMLYGSRARIIMSHDLVGPVKDYWSQPCAQFVFRGDELMEGQQMKNIRSFVGDHQWVYKEDYRVNWTELQVWIGVPVPEKAEVGVYACAPCFDGSRRCTRPLNADQWNLAGLSWTKHAGAKKPVDDDPFPVISSMESADNVRPEGW